MLPTLHLAVIRQAVLEQMQSSAGRKHALDLAKRQRRIRNGAQRERRDDAIDGAVLERQRLASEPHDINRKRRPSHPRLGEFNSPPRRLNYDKPLHLGRIQGKVVTRTETNLKHSAVCARNGVATMHPKCLTAAHAINRHRQHALFVETTKPAHRW